MYYTYDRIHVKDLIENRVDVYIWNNNGETAWFIVKIIYSFTLSCNPNSNEYIMDRENDNYSNAKIIQVSLRTIDGIFTRILQKVKRPP